MEMTTTQPPPAAARPARRDYYRCGDCLEAVVLARSGEWPARVHEAPCVCGGRLVHMGEIRRHRVVRVEEHPACDARCTNATGPSCDCQCGGANHGTGRTVEVVYDQGAAPRLRVADPARQLARAAEHRKLVEELDAAINRSRWGWAYRAKIAGEFVPGQDAWLAAEQIRRDRRHALGLKTHAGRRKAVAAMLARLAK